MHEKSDAELVKKVCKEHKLGSNDYIAPVMQSSRLEHKGVDEYLGNVLEQNASNKQQIRQNLKQVRQQPMQVQQPNSLVSQGGASNK